MEACVLCLKAPSTMDNYIHVNSQKWWQSDVLGIIEKHFWPIDDPPNTDGICFLCWSKLNEFHIFYQNIEEAHRKITYISKETEMKNSWIEKEMFEISAPQVDKSKLSHGEIRFADEEFSDDDITFEDSPNEYEHLFCEPSARISGEITRNPITIKQRDKITSNPISIEKRKRGRPRKEKLVNKPKGKRGRPRKDSKVVIHGATLSKIGTVQQFNNTKELETSAQCDLITTVNNSNQPKKKGRGRPRKIEKQDENSNRIKELSELAMPDNDVPNKKSSEGEELLNDTFSNLKETVNKKRKLLSLMKKRKPIQQHKALMRKYIATSVRCMKFLKK